ENEFWRVSLLTADPPPSCPPAQATEHAAQVLMAQTRDMAPPAGVSLRSHVAGGAASIEQTYQKNYKPLEEWASKAYAGTVGDARESVLNPRLAGKTGPRTIVVDVTPVGDGPHNMTVECDVIDATKAKHRVYEANLGSDDFKG